MLRQLAQHGRVGISLLHQRLQHHLLALVGLAQLLQRVIDSFEGFGHHFFQLANTLVIGHTGYRLRLAKIRNLHSISTPSATALATLLRQHQATIEAELAPGTDTYCLTLYGELR